MRAIALLIAAAAAAAAVPGLPEPGPAGAWPRLLVASGNDLFGNGVGNGDDARTAAAALQMRAGPLLAAVDGALLTDRAGGTRRDVLLGSVLWSWGGRQPALGWQAAAALGGGAKVEGRLGGAEVQNGVHRLRGIAAVPLAYDREGATLRPLAAATALVGWLGTAEPLLTGWWGLQAGAGSWLTATGETDLAVGPRLVLVGRDASWWLAGWYRWWGGPEGPTQAAVAAHERGWWAEIGTDAVPFAGWGYRVRSGWNPETRAAFGSVGAVWEPGRAAPGRELWLEHELALYSGGGLGVQLRWHPWPWQDAGRVSALLLDYRFGTEPDGTRVLGWGDGDAPAEADLRHDQLALGWEEALRSPRWGAWRGTGFAQARAGARHEGLRLTAARGSRVLARHTAPALSAGVGARVEWRDLASLGASWEGWLPAWDERVQKPQLSVRLNDPGWALGLHLAVHLAW